MLAAERHIQIMNMLMKMKIVHTQVLAEHFNVSEMTIRRDLNYLAKDNVLTRSHGGAMINEYFISISNYNAKQNANYDEKQAIAKYAASLIQDGQTIAINTSSNTACIVEHILDKKITLVTNSLDVLNIASKSNSINLIVTSGTFVRDYRSFEGTRTINDYESYNFDLAFIGANGIDDAIYTGASLEAEAKKTIIAQSKKAYILTEHTKFGHKGKIKIADLEAHMIITSSLSKPMTKGYKNIIYVNEKGE